MHHLESAVFRILSPQSTTVGIDDGYYTVDLLGEILQDPRIADADLNLVAYRELLGDSEWAALLAKHAHEK